MEEKQPLDWKQMIIMTVLIGVTAWAAMNYMSNNQKQEPEKKPAATDKADKPAEAKDTAAKKPVREKAPAAEPEEAAETDEPAAAESPAGIISRTVDYYDGVDAYTVDFYLTQPRNHKETRNPDQMDRLREHYVLEWEKNALNTPAKDSFRLTGVNGFNKCTIAAYRPDKQSFTVYHPRAAAMQVPADDSRMADLFDMGIHGAARRLQQSIRDKDSEVEVKTESTTLPGLEDSADYFIITITKKDNSREVAAVNADTGALEMFEMLTYNKKGKTESQRYWTSRRLVWFDFKARDGGQPADWYTRAPDFEKLNCSR